MSKPVILIVEDKDEFRKIYGDRLRFGGYDVLDARDGNEALTILRSQPIAVVMTDINMPNKDGFELIADMKADPVLKTIPILVMSVFDRGDHLEKAISLGADAYLVKGMHTPNQVLEQIKSMVK